MSCFPAGLPAAAARAVKDEGGEGSPVLHRNIFKRQSLEHGSVLFCEGPKS